nr:hypothetical protein [Tanacetum cinerariifolium]
MQELPWLLLQRRRRAISTGSEGVNTASRIFSSAEESVSTTDMEKERTKRAGLNLQEESSKWQKTEEGSESTKEPDTDEISQKDLQQIMMIVPVEEVYVKAPQVQKPIDEEIMKDSELKSMGNVTFDDLPLGTYDSPYDTESGIK